MIWLHYLIQTLNSGKGCFVMFNDFTTQHLLIFVGAHIIRIIRSVRPNKHLTTSFDILKISSILFLNTVNNVFIFNQSN